MARNWAFKDETGNTYGRLTVVEFAGKDARGQATWKCLCRCGTETVARGEKLRKGEKKSCGCLRSEMASNRTRLSEEEKIKRLTEPRECSMCHKVLPPDQFKFVATRHWCIKCKSAWHKEHNKDNHRRIRLRDHYSLTEEEYEEMSKSQNHSCAICGNKPGNGRLHVDHDHGLNKGDSEFVRGLLCSKCNSGLGFFKDNVDFLLSAAKYLKKVT